MTDGQRKRRLAEHLISTPAKPARCQDCGAAILRGYEGGMPARVDPAPVNALGEILALVAGRWTYAMRGGVLAYREDWHLRAGFPERGVFVAHGCRGWPPDTRR